MAVLERINGRLGHEYDIDRSAAEGNFALHAVEQSSCCSSNSSRTSKRCCSASGSWNLI
jgi:hypothetical protein